MYEKFFQFKEPPFNLTPDPRFFFFSKQHQEAFSHILYGVQKRQGFIVVTGEVGTGKTTLCRMLLSRLDKNVKTAMLFNPNLTPLELHQAVVQDFGIASTASTKKELVEALNQFLLRQLGQGGNALLIVDEAQNLSVECLEEIRMLSNLETDKEKLIQILLVAQPELREKLSLHELRQLNQRISLRYHLEPLSLEETKAYMAFRLQVAGGKDRVLFTPNAIEAVHRYAGGIPRLINVVSDKALLAAFVGESRVVNDHLIRKAIQEVEGKSSESRRSGRTQRQDLKPRPVWFSASGLVTLAALLVTMGGVWWYTERVRAMIPASPPMQPALPAVSAPTVQAESVQPAAAELHGLPDRDEAHVSPEVLPQIIEPTPPPLSPFDDHGIYRVQDAGRTRAAAHITLARLWMGEAAGLDGADLNSFSLEEIGFNITPFRVSLERLRFFGYPVVLRSGSRYAVLSRLTDREAEVLDPIEGRLQPAPADLFARWDRTVFVVWKPIQGVSTPLRMPSQSKKAKTRGPDPAVRQLQKALMAQGLYLGQADGVYGVHTLRAVRFFQQKHGLKDDGVFGLESHLLLSRLGRSETVPSLVRQEPSG
jgi:general secretion pathway protein A